MTNVENTIQKIRDYLDVSGVTRSGFATIAGVPEGCVRDIHSPEWNPTASTLKKLEKALPPKFKKSKSKKPRSN